MPLRLLALIAAVGCGGRVHTGDEPGDTHVTDGAGEALSPAEARSRFDRAVAAGRPRDIVVAAGALDRLTPTERTRVLAAVDDVAAAELAAVAEELAPDRFPGPEVARRLTKIGAHLGKPPSGRVDPGLIAVLLPRSGPYRGLGGELEGAIKLAGRHDRSARLHFLDTQGDEARAIQMVERAFELGAVAAIGPLGDAESRAAARRAAELGLPIALLSPEEGAAADAGVFRLFVSPEWEAREAARLALDLGYDAPAVFHPRDEHGAAAAAAFRQRAAAGGVEVTVASYDPTGTDLEPDVKRLLGLDPVTNSRLRRHLARQGRKQGWKTFSPDVTFDLLYIPDDYARAALIASYLPFFNVELRSAEIVDTLSLRRKHGGRIPSVVQLLGSSGWHHDSLIPRGGPAVDGALIVDVWAGSETEEYVTEQGAELGARYQEAGRAASSIAAQAYDATALVLAARRALSPRAADPRAAFVRSLRATRVDGVAGTVAIDDTGTIVREPVLLQVDGGQFVLFTP